MQRLSHHLACLPVAMLLLPISALSDSSRNELRFNTNGKFKIVQFTDIHWAHQSPKCEEVIRTMESVLDAEKPDLVILTGDIVTSTPSAKGWAAVTRPMVERQISWAVTLGNHDDEHDMNRKEIMALLETMPYSCVSRGPEDLAGEGNYVLKIRHNTKSRVAAVIYCIDSLAYAPQPYEANGHYAWIEPSQIEWYRKNSREITEANRNQPLPSLAFFHIPLPEYNDAWNNKTSTPIGTKGEAVCCPKKNTGMLSAMVECRGIMGVFVGHDHDNDFAGYQKGICLAYGRRAGVDTYGDLPPCGRTIELLQGKREFNTWLHTADGGIHHRVHYPGSFIKDNAQQVFPADAGKPLR